MTNCRIERTPPPQLALVRGRMPVMDGIRAEATVTRPLSGHRISGCVPLTRETGVLVEALLAAGAEVAWTAETGPVPADDIAVELTALGARLTRREDTGSRPDPRPEADVLDAFPRGPTLVVDSGALLSETVRRHPARFPDLVAATETTVEGVVRIRAWHRKHTLTFPVTSVVPAAPADEDWAGACGAGPSVVDGIVRTTGLSLAGKRFVVGGFDRAGRDIALRARELGAQVFVTCDSDRVAVLAALAGFDVLPAAGAVSVGDVVCRTVRRPEPLAEPRLRRLPGGAILCDLPPADESGTADRATLVDELFGSPLGSPLGPHRLVRADGRHPAGGPGPVPGLGRACPPEAADLSLARLALTLVRSAARGSGRAPGLYPVPYEHDEEIARRKLAAMNVATDSIMDRAAAEVRRVDGTRWSRPVVTGRNSGRPISAALRLEQAATRMPLLAALRRDFAPVTPLDGQRIVVRGELTAEMATAALTLVELGAEVAWSGEVSGAEGEEIAGLLRRPRLSVHTATTPGGEQGHGVLEALHTWPQGPTLVLDDTTVLLDALHREPAAPRWPAFAVERTLDGAAVSGRLPSLRLPVLTGERSFARRVVDDLRGSARALLETIGAASGRLLPGKVFVVAGFGRLGARVAAEARGLGARVVVTEVDPVRALQAVLDGFQVLSMARAARAGDFFCTVTDAPDVIRRQHLMAMKAGAVLANAGHPRAIDTGTLGRMTVRWPVSPTGVRLYDTTDGRRLCLVDDGLVTDRASAGEGLAEALDIALANQVLAACLALPRVRELAPGVHPLPAGCDGYVASELAAFLGVALHAGDPGAAPRASGVGT